MNKLQHKKSKNFIYADENGVDVRCGSSVMFKTLKHLLYNFLHKGYSRGNRRLDKKYRDPILDWLEWQFGCRCCAERGLRNIGESEKQ